MYIYISFLSLFFLHLACKRFYFWDWKGFFFPFSNAPKILHQFYPYFFPVVFPYQYQNQKSKNILLAKVKFQCSYQTQFQRELQENTIFIGRSLKPMKNVVNNSYAVSPHTSASVYVNVVQVQEAPNSEKTLHYICCWNMQCTF